MRLRKLRYKIKYNGHRKNEVVLAKFNSKGHIVHIMKSMYKLSRYFKRVRRFQTIYPLTMYTYYYKKLFSNKVTPKTKLEYKLFNRGIIESTRTYRIRRSI